jgi:mevalonate kinase
MTSASALGKVILCGEHAVVYGRAALAFPVYQIQATTEVVEIQGAEKGTIHIHAPDIEYDTWLHEMDDKHPLTEAVRLTLDAIRVSDFTALEVEIHSSIPLAAGLGSSAAVSVSIIRALSQHLGHPLPPDNQSEIAFEVEKWHHGTPSGIDNTVVAFEQPIFFIRGEAAKPFMPGADIHLVIGNTGIESSTLEAVSKVREGWLEEKEYYEALFDQIDFISRLAYRAIKAGQIHVLGILMNHNQVILETLGVSSPELERLIRAARENGAIGAKLSGAGLGGNMIALVRPGRIDDVTDAMQDAGAVRTISTVVEA